MVWWRPSLRLRWAERAATWCKTGGVSAWFDRGDEIGSHHAFSDILENQLISRNKEVVYSQKVLDRILLRCT